MSVITGMAVFGGEGGLQPPTIEDGGKGCLAVWAAGSGRVGSGSNYFQAAVGGQWA